MLNGSAFGRGGWGGLAGWGGWCGRGGWGGFGCRDGRGGRGDWAGRGGWAKKLKVTQRYKSLNKKNNFCTTRPALLVKRLE